MKAKIFIITLAACGLMLFGASCSGDSALSQEGNGAVVLEEDESTTAPEEDESTTAPEEDESTTVPEEDGDIVALDITPSEVPPFPTLDCRDTYGFLDHYLRNRQIDDLLLLKCVVVKENVLSSGIQFEVIEDIRGNFKDPVPQFIFWGAHVHESPDILQSAAENDIFFVMAIKYSWKNANGISCDYYAAYGCAHCLAKLSEGNVVGVLYNGYKKDVLPLKDFLKKLKE